MPVTTPRSDAAPGRSVSTTTATAAAAATPTPTPRPGRERTMRVRLGRRARRATLVAHIVAAGAWIGIDVVLGVLALTAVTTSSDTTEAVAYQALDLFVVWPLLVTGALTLATGIGLGLGTNFGLVRYWWVAVKLAMNVVLVTLIAFVLRPGISEAARHGEQLTAGARGDIDPSGLLFAPIVSLTALVAATALAVVKPWGKTPWAR